MRTPQQQITHINLAATIKKLFNTREKNSHLDEIEVFVVCRRIDRKIDEIETSYSIPFNSFCCCIVSSLLLFFPSLLLDFDCFVLFTLFGIHNLVCRSLSLFNFFFKIKCTLLVPKTNQSPVLTIYRAKQCSRR